jgi:SAM-dependent methyltransferase
MPDDVLTRHNLDVHIRRQGIVNAIKAELPRFHGTLLDVGCGRMPYRELLLSPPSRVTKYIGLDRPGGIYAQYGPFDLEWDGRVIPLPDGSVECALLTEVLEQCPDPDAVLKEIARVLVPGGFLFFSVPFMWPIHSPPYDQYRYTPFALDRLLKGAGFGNIDLKAEGGWDASLAQMIGLWTRRRLRGRMVRAIVSVVVFPIVKRLIAVDRPPDLRDLNATEMVTGMTGTACRS